MHIDNDGFDTIRNFSAPFKNFKTRSATRGKQSNILQKAYWIVDGLQYITKDLSNIAQQDEVI
jgi:hypothetical protein